MPDQPGLVTPLLLSPSPTDSTKSNGPKFIIDQFLPVRQLHLFAGPSGAGKTTLLLQMLESIYRVEPFFGRETHPVPFVYVSCERNKEGTDSTFERMSINPAMFTVIDGINFKSPFDVIKKVLELHPPTKLIVIEGIAMLTEDKMRDSDYGAVGRWLRKIVSTCYERDITVIGTVHSPKMKEKERYENPRQRVHGSVAWGAVGDTIFIVEPSKDSPLVRDVYVLPRNSAELKLEMTFENGNGRLIPIVGMEETANQNWLKKWLLTQPVEWTTADLIEAGEKDVIPLAERTIKRLLNWALEVGLAKKVHKGRYCSTHLNILELVNKEPN